MKKLFFLAATTLIFFSCNNKQKDANGNATENFSEMAKQVADLHNGKNSADYEGIYKGTLPTASGEGMEVTIKLSANEYTRTISYVGKENSTSTDSGTYVWDTTGNIITLEGVDTPNQYFVSENQLIQLDIDGQKIVGELANDYILKKE